MLTIEHPTSPYFAEIRNGLPHNAQIRFDGVVTIGQQRAIWFELRTSNAVACHVNIRLGFQNENTIVLNTQRHGHWGIKTRLQPAFLINQILGSEERHHNHYVMPGQPISFCFTNNRRDFHIKINGRTFHLHHPHRIDLCDVNRVEIRGDIALHRLNFSHLDGHIVTPQQQIAAAAAYSLPHFHPPLPQHHHHHHVAVGYTPTPYYAAPQPTASPVVGFAPSASLGIQAPPPPPQPTQPYPNSLYPNLPYPSASY